MLPNNRKECESGLEIYSIILNIKLAGQTSGFDPNGAQNKSRVHPKNP